MSAGIIHFPSTDTALRLRQIPQHCVEDAAVAVVLNLDGGVDAAGGDEVDSLAVGLDGGHFDSLTWLEVVVESDLEGFGAVEFQEVAGFPFAVLQRENSHADEIRAVDTLERGCDDGADAEQVRSLRCPVTR